MARGDQSPSVPAGDQAGPGETAVREQLARIQGSADFAQSERMKSFLGFVVEETLAGRAEALKEYTIATQVFDRDETFDPQTNTIVRVEAGRLRRRLERYYLTEGSDDAVRIDLPKGSYVPLFRATQPAPPPPAAASRQDRPGQSEARDDEQRDVATELPTGPSIAVLRFENMSGDPGQDFFADGVSEEIINDLTRFPNLRVVSRHSTFKYKGRHVDVREVGQDLGVRYVLEGSVRKAGDMIRVTGQLTDAVDGGHLFSETYDRDLSGQSILDIQDDIADRIVAAVGAPHGVVGRAALRRSRGKAAQSIGAYDAVMRFYEYLANASSQAHKPVLTALEQAVELDPGYASAWAALASVHLDAVRFGFNSGWEGNPLDRALQAAQRAVMLEPDSSMAYHFLFTAHFHRGELDDFRATGERAVRLNPNHTDMLADYGLMLALTGEWERGIALAQKAIALSPTHPGWFHCAAVADHYRKEEFEAALAEAKQIQMPEFFANFMMLAMCYGQLGRDREGRSACDKLLELAPDFSERAWDFLAAWNMSEELSGQIVDGLRKAGLRIPDRPD
ncbi:hypothetical protein [Pelagibius sp.]|uniref:hypothetical protein n=1 Tax=Pelagibius sp. TaxID=1931238 RepID=UPI00262E36C3|nr:hypothetical protein [Pelagibius sp.]